jgi:hypothetical protein
MERRLAVILVADDAGDTWQMGVDQGATVLPVRALAPAIHDAALRPGGSDE